MPRVVFIRLEPYPARYARYLPHAGKAFRFFPETSSWAVDSSLCEIIFARKEEEWVEGSPRKAATFDGDTENIFAWFIFIGSCCIRRCGAIFPHQRNAIKLRKSLATQRLASPFGGSAEGNRGMPAVIEQCWIYRSAAPSALRAAPPMGSQERSSRLT